MGNQWRRGDYTETRQGTTNPPEEEAVYVGTSSLEWKNLG